MLCIDTKVCVTSRHVVAGKIHNMNLNRAYSTSLYVLLHPPRWWSEELVNANQFYHQAPLPLEYVACRLPREHTEFFLHISARLCRASDDRQKSVGKIRHDNVCGV